MVVGNVLCAGISVTAEDVRYYQEDGVTYRETRRTVRRPVSQTTVKPIQRTVYRQQWVEQTKPCTRTRWTAVTECRWEPRLVGRWNPFVQPYFEYRLVPRTQWRAETETVDVPVRRCELVPVTQTVEAPVTECRIVEEEIVSRVAVGGGPPALPAQNKSPPLVARRQPIGGVARLENDPPRLGAGAAWRPSTSSD